jgi:hypothetical protein
MSINPNYIHHITDEEYRQALLFISEGLLPAKNSRSALARFKRRWNGANVETYNGKRIIVMKSREVVPQSKIQEILSKLYDDPSTGGFGRDKFYERVKNQYVGITRSDVEKFISNDEIHQLYRPISNKIKVVHPLAIPKGPNIHWQIDLIDMGQNKKHENLGYQYCLTVIDIFSKYAWVKPLKSKEAIEVVDALELVFSASICPKVVQSDNGAEFKNRLISKMCEKHSMKQIFSSAYRPQSQGCVERFNGTLKRLLFKHMSRFKTKVWIDVLDKIIDNYRSIKHSSTGYSPECLHMTKDFSKIKKAREKMLMRNSKWLQQSKKKHFKDISIGDYVRVSIEVFKENRKHCKYSKKSLQPNWTKEIFKVESIIDNSRLHLPMYRVKSISNGKILQVHRDNLQFIPGPNPRITNLATRQKNGQFNDREGHCTTAENSGLSSNINPIEVVHLVPNRP